MSKPAERQAQEDKVSHPLIACSPEVPGELALEEKEERLCFCGTSNKVHSCPAMERPFTVLQVSLHHPTQDLATCAHIPSRLQHDTSPLLVGRGQDTHLRLPVPHLSRQHLSLEPYRETGSTELTFCIKTLSRKGWVWVNGLTLRFLEQVPLSTVNKVIFCEVQMVVHIEKGASLEAFICYFQLSPSPLIYFPQAVETDESESSPQAQHPLGSDHRALDDSDLPCSPLQLRPGRGPEIQLQGEPPDHELGQRMSLC